MDPQEGRTKSKYEVYLEERKLLVDAEREGARTFDKAILTLAAGALGLSVTFVDKIAPLPQATTLWLLVASWISFGFSIIVTLSSFITSQWACIRQREILDTEWLNSSQEQKSIQNCWTRVTNALNVVSILSFVTGVIFLCLFAFVNLSKEAAMSEKKKDYGFTPQKPPATPLEKGFVPPKPPEKPIEEGYVPPKLPSKPPAVPPDKKD